MINFSSILLRLDSVTSKYNCFRFGEESYYDPDGVLSCRKEHLL